MESSTKVSHNEHVYLDLRLCNYGIDNISALEKYILPNLTTLYISTNGINVNGCNVISKLLRSKETKLEFLRLSTGFIGLLEGTALTVRATAFFFKAVPPFPVQASTLLEVGL